MFYGADGHFQFENIHESVICAMVRMDIFSYLCSDADFMSSLFHIFHFSFLNEKRDVQMKISASRTSKIRPHTDLDRHPSKNKSFGELTAHAKPQLLLCTGQVRSGQVRSGQVEIGQDRSGQDKTRQDMSTQIRTGQDRSGQIRTGNAVSILI